MSTGIFDTSRSHGQAHRFNKRRSRTRAIDKFAEALAEHDIATGDKGGSVPEVSKRLGVSPQYGNAMLQRIRRGLGPQAT